MRLSKFFLSLALMLSAVGASAQDMAAAMMQPLPVDPKVRVGKLDNGLTYYIRHNEEPKNQAFFYIAQKVGSIQEEESQRGLAHFLEHMCFNGTTHFPDSSLIEYLESIGVKFGAQLNAYTSVEETVYNIDNVPAREGAIDSCLLILHDWSHDLTLDGKEIDKERGVIHGEWRMRNSGITRILVRNLEKLMSDSRYGRRFPIGLMKVVDECPYDTLRAYYHKWYRPDLQGIIVVGDVDVDAIEGKIKKLFSPIQLQQPVAKREYFSVPDNTEAIIVSDKDPELTSQGISIAYKHEAVPDSIRNTIGVYLSELTKGIACGVINQRLGELALKPECPFKSASVYDGPFLLSRKVTGAFNIDVEPKEGMAQEAVQAVMAEVYRADQHGFTKGEVDRLVAETVSNMEQTYNNREKQRSINYAREYYSSFLNNEPIPGIEVEYQLVQQILPQMPLDAFNKIFQQLVSRSDTNLVVMAVSPEKEGFEIPTEQQLINAIHSAQTQELTPWVDNVKTGPLVAQLPKPGKVVKSEKCGFGSKMFTLSNGVRVIMKETDFKDDEIRMTAWSDGGTARYGVGERINLEAFDAVVGRSKLGGFTRVELGKALAGKQASADVSISARSEGFSGSSSKKDLRTMFELIYMHFMPLERDDAAVEAWKTSLREELRNKNLNPLASFSDSVQSTLYSHHPLTIPMTEADVDKIDYNRILQIYADRMADASDFTFLFVGNVNEDSLRLLAEQYLATLPVAKRDDSPADNGLREAAGDITNHYRRDMQTPQGYVVAAWAGPIQRSVANEAKVSILGQCLAEVYLKKIREELGAAYSTHATGSVTRNSADEPIYILQAIFPLKPEMIDTCVQIAEDVFHAMAVEGPKEESVSKAREYMLKTYTQNQRENSFWMRRLATQVRRGYDPYENYEKIVSAITPADIRDMAAYITSMGNVMRVILEPEHDGDGSSADAQKDNVPAE